MQMLSLKMKNKNSGCLKLYLSECHAISTFPFFFIPTICASSVLKDEKYMVCSIYFSEHIV